MVERRRSADKRVFVAFGLLTLMFCAGLYRVEDTRREADRKLRAAAVARVAQSEQEARRRAEQIQESRRDVLIRSCRDQNARHDNVIAQLDKLIADIPPGARRARAKRGRTSTVLLLEALAPHRDCARRAARLIG